MMFRNYENLYIFLRKKKNDLETMRIYIFFLRKKKNDLVKGHIIQSS